MIKEVIKGYTVFNGLYQSRNKKMYSRIENKEVTGNKLYKGFFNEWFNRLTLNLWDVQLDIKGYTMPEGNENVKELIRQMKVTVNLLQGEQNEYGQYIMEQTQQFLEWWENTFQKQVRPLIKVEVKRDYFEALKQHFTPEEQFKNFVFGKEFSKLNFNGTVAQLAGIFKQINKNADLIKPSWEQTAEYIISNFTVNNSPINENTLLRYFNGKKPISGNTQIEIKI